MEELTDTDKNLDNAERELRISDVMFSEERTEVKCCIGGYVIEKDQFGATGRIFKCDKCNT